MLKPLRQARLDGDKIYGLVKGVAVNHGGKVATVTSPNPFAQARCVEMALRDAALSPAAIGYIEAHGTGTPKGDPIEMNALIRAYASQARVQGVELAARSCAIGSVKTSIGHLEAAAGIAGIIKVLLQLRHNRVAGVAGLNRIDPALRLDLRTRYWARVAALAETSVAGKVLVDMNPFNGIKLPILARLFPQARFVVMRRDPRDVVLSCFRVNFTPGAGAWAFSDLEETARHYDSLMRLIDLVRETLPIATHDVRYDRLVGEFEPTVRALAKFIGIAWTEDFAAFASTARNRGVRTASETQVRKGLYNGGGQWRRYADQLGPVLPILAPWIERFGSGD